MSENCSSVSSAPPVAAMIPLEEEQSTPSSIIQRFIESVDNGDVRTELAENCILSLFGRHITGIDSVTGYMRTQLMGRFRHSGFRDAQVCDPADEVILRERFARTFDRTRRRLYQQKERKRASTLHLRAESDDEELVGRGSTHHLVTPPRPSSHNMELFAYIQAKGTLEPIHDANDGGINLGDSRQVQLTLAYRKEQSDEIYLALYEKFRQLRQKSTLTPPTPPTNQLRSTETDNEEQAGGTTTTSSQPRSVRRTLFASAKDDLEEEDDKKANMDMEPPTPSLPAVAAVAAAAPAASTSPAATASPSRSLVATPRKRHNRNQTDVESKRPAGLRFYI